MSDPDRIPLKQPSFTSASEFSFSEKDAFASIMEMLNLQKFEAPLQSAIDILNEYPDPIHLKYFLAAEGISCAGVDPLPDVSGIPLSISLLAQVASNYVMAVAEIEDCDLNSALSFIAEEFNPDIDWTIGDYATAFVAAVAVIGTLCDPFVGDEGLAAWGLGILGLIGAGVDLTATTIEFANDEEASNWWFMINMLTSSLPFLPGISDVALARTGIVRAAHPGMDTAQFTSFLTQRFTAMNGTRPLNILAWFDRPDTALDIASYLGIPIEDAQQMINDAKSSLDQFKIEIGNLSVPLESTAPGAITIEVPTKARGGRDIFRLHTWMIHHGVAYEDASKMLYEPQVRGEWSAFWDKYPGLNEAVPPDLSDVITNLP